MTLKSIFKNINSKSVKEKAGISIINFIKSSKKEEYVYNLIIEKTNTNEVLITLPDGSTYKSFDSELIDFGKQLLYE